MNLSVIIPSRTLTNLKACVEAVWKHEPTARVIVVWDQSRNNPDMPPADMFEVHTVDSPFVFSKSVNIGLAAAGTDDCVVANDDSLLQSPGGFSLMQQAAVDYPEFGIIGATCNNVGNVNQHPKGIGLREDRRMVCFVGVLIPRRTIDTVGLLDEEFTGYSHQDDDYCVRVRRAGLKIGIHDGCYLDHKTLVSTFRGPGGPGGSLTVGAEIFRRKWGADNRSI